MITKPRIRKRRIEKLLSRAGGGTKQTNRLDEISEVARREIRGLVHLGKNEEFLLSSYHSEGEWCTLTTERLIWATEGQMDSRPWEKVHGVQMPARLVKSVILDEIKKFSLEELEVFDEKEFRHIIHSEPGEGYYLVLSAITALCNPKREPEWPSFMIPSQG